MVKSFFKYINIIQKSAPPLIVVILCCYIHSMLSSPGFEISWLYAFSIIWQRWSNIFGFNSDLNLFPRILNIRIQIREFWRPNNIRIFKSFSSNLKYLKHIFPLNFQNKLVIFICPADLLIPFAGTNGQDLCLDVTVTWYLKELFEYAFSIPAFCLLFSMFKYNWIIRIIFEYSNLFRGSNIFESYLKSRIIFGFGFENFLSYE